ncbi:MAG TPA: LamG-like jellyroll fold domain-containing protein [Modestobacter sp.]|nr:LamG-like jellyroll fold domain-containing protein [Modestobacter sp.]
MTAPVPTATPAWRQGWAALAVSTLSRIVLGALGLLLAASVLPALVGWQSSVVMSGSMAPTFTTGDVAVVRPVTTSALEPGQVLLVDDPDVPGQLRLHRLVAVEAGGLQLKGDANPAADGSLVDPGTVHGVVTLGLPLVGEPAVWFAERRVWPLAGTAAGLVALLALALMHRRPDDEPPAGPPAAPTTSTTTDSSRAPRRRYGELNRVLRRGTVLSAAVLVAVALPGAAAKFTDTTATPNVTVPMALWWNCPDVGGSTGAGAARYYRLQEGSGTVATNTGSAGSAANGTYSSGSSGGISYAVNGPNCGANDGKAVRLNGTSGAIWTTQQIANPQTFSLQLWFSTTSTSGGKLIGFGNGANGSASSLYDRHVYLSNAGKLLFGIYNNGYFTIASPNSYNDGGWHLMSATFSAGTGMRLYVDGGLVASGTPTTAAENTTGYWRIGYDSLGSGWPNYPTSAWYAGALAQVSIYDTVLSATQVQQAWDITR